MTPVIPNDPLLLRSYQLHFDEGQEVAIEYWCPGIWINLGEGKFLEIDIRTQYLEAWIGELEYPHIRNYNVMTIAGG